MSTNPIVRICNPDHLGISSYITNLDGAVSQHMEYLPFGETLVDEHLNSRNSPFKYNGKEFDEETGNYYYGARYYDPKWSIFVSVDPLAEKTMSSYGYCYNNPINLIDPTGMMASEYDNPTDPPKQGQGTTTGTMETLINGMPSGTSAPPQEIAEIIVNGKSANYRDWQKKGQEVIKVIDAWLTKHTYLEGTATLKTGTYIDVGIKHTGRATLGNYDESGYSWSNQEGLQNIRTNKYVAGVGMEAGAQYTYDTRRRKHSGSLGYNILSAETDGDSSFIGININLSAGIGIGGEAGFKIGFKF